MSISFTYIAFLRFRGSMTVMEVNGSVALAQYTEELANKTSDRYKLYETYMIDLVRISFKSGNSIISLHFVS